jgi:hypothetical protein
MSIWPLAVRRADEDGFGHGAGRRDIFEWVVLDPSGRLDRPGSTWRYELVPVGARGQTRVRHRFVHGPGDTGLRRGMEGSPDEAAAVLAERLATLGANMTVTIERMARS